MKQDVGIWFQDGSSISKASVIAVAAKSIAYSCISKSRRYDRSAVEKEETEAIFEVGESETSSAVITGRLRSRAGRALKRANL
jgi:hypothetical protein